MKTVVVLQSNYIPWKGYFDLIHDADLFIFYDDVQYTKNDWRNRNKIQTPQGPRWLTIPTGINTDRRICDVELIDHRWQSSHWESIRQTYRNSPYFKLYKAFFEDIYRGREWASLSELNQQLIQRISQELLGIPTRFDDSRNYASGGAKQERLLNLLTAAGTEHYISGPAARAYIDEEAFATANIRLTWKDYSNYPVYPQGPAPFEHGVSIIDLLFNTGPQAAWHIWGWRDGGQP